MRQMAAMRQIEPQNRVPMLQNGHISRRIGLRTRMRLHIRVNCHSRHSKKLLGPVPSEIFNHVRILAAAVIPLPRIPFGILVRKHRTGSLKHGFRNEVLAGNHLQPLVLAQHFMVNGGSHLRIGLGERKGKCVAEMLSHTRILARAKPGLLSNLHSLAFIRQISF